MRKEVKEFAKQMEIILRQNDNKLHWSNVDIEDLWNLLMLEIRELRFALDELRTECLSADYRGDRKSKEEKYEIIFKNIKKECIDVANFAMMIYDNTK